MLLACKQYVWRYGSCQLIESFKSNEARLSQRLEPGEARLTTPASSLTNKCTLLSDSRNVWSFNQSHCKLSHSFTLLILPSCQEPQQVWGWCEPCGRVLFTSFSLPFFSFPQLQKKKTLKATVRTSKPTGQHTTKHLLSKKTLGGYRGVSGADSRQVFPNN